MLLSSLAVTYVLVHVLSVDRLSLNFKARLKLIALTLTSMRGQKRQLYDFFVEIGFFFKFTKLLISNLKNQSGRVWTTRTKVLLHVSFIGLPFTWLNGILTLSSCPYIYWLILSASLWCYVRMRRLISTTRTLTMAHRCAEISTNFYLLFKYVVFIADFWINTKNWVTSDTRIKKSGSPESWAGFFYRLQWPYMATLEQWRKQL